MGISRGKSPLNLKFFGVDLHTVGLVQGRLQVDAGLKASYKNNNVINFLIFSTSKFTVITGNGNGTACSRSSQVFRIFRGVL